MFFEIVMAHKSSTLLLRMPYILLAFTNSAPLAAPSDVARERREALLDEMASQVLDLL